MKRVISRLPLSLWGGWVLVLLLIALPLVLFSTQTSQDVRQHAATSLPDPTQYTSPYGFTTVHADQNLVTLYQQLNVHWVRYQVEATNIDWNALDATVALLNAAHIHIDFPIHCLTGSCFSNPPQPSISQVSSFATQIASRYNGTSGHGFIDAYEIGNEEFDFYPPSSYGPYLQAGCQAVKLASPNALCGMYGTYQPNLSHYTAVVQDLFQGGYGKDMDFLNFHYYVRGGDPAGPGSGMPSFDQVWQSFHTIASQYGFSQMPIWVTEVGWPTVPVSCCQAVSPQTQAQYMQYVFDHARTSGVIQRVFWFTINYGTQGDTIYPPSGPLPAFSIYQQYVKNYPLWSNQPQPSAITPSFVCGGSAHGICLTIPPTTTPLPGLSPAWFLSPTPSSTSPSTLSAIPSPHSHSLPAVPRDLHTLLWQILDLLRELFTRLRLSLYAHHRHRQLSSHVYRIKFSGESTEHN